MKTHQRSLFQLPLLALPALLTGGATLAPAAAGPHAVATSIEQSAEDAAVIKVQLPSYPLSTCVISGEALGSEEMGPPIDMVHEGRLIRVCCKGCIKQVKKDPAKIIAKIDAAVIAQQGPSYPMKTCPITGEALGSMGDPIDFVHGTRLVRFCCKGCVKGFKKDPKATMAKVDAALIAAQIKTYPAKICMVSGEELGNMGDPIDLLHGTRLVRLCCKGCKRAFYKNPSKFIAELDKLAKPAKG